jgi:hypothetical protein
LGQARDETHKKQGKEKHKAQEHKSTKEKGKIIVLKLAHAQKSNNAAF